jgi:serine protease inhibitor
MKKSILVLVISIITLLVISSCDKDRNNEDLKDINLNSKQKSLVISGNTFSINLLKAISEDEAPTDNYMISPLSISLALAMTANGAKNNTLDEMLNVMGFENSDIDDFNEFFRLIVYELLNLDNKVTLTIANSIWYRDSFAPLQSFLDTNEEYYNAEISALDFSHTDAVNIINQWVSDATNRKIGGIIQSIPNDVLMYLINAIYFYGQWQYEFDKSQTKERDFYLSSGESIKVTMMEMEADLKYFDAGNMQMIEIPYGKGNFVMNVILPPNGVSPTQLLSDFDYSSWAEWTSGLYEKEVVLYMPKFKFEYSKSLVSALQSLGMIDLFNEIASDLSGINGTGGLFVSDVKHKTFIDVNEEGTEAAAVTATEVGTTSVNPDMPIYINLNRPFVFIIREISTEVILFAGVVSDPSKE